MMGVRKICAIGGVVAAVGFVGALNHFWADAAGMAMKPTASLSGSEEVPPKASNGTGQFEANVPASHKSMSYQLTYSGLSTRATAAHIHLGKKGANGGVAAFLCGGGGKPSCPAAGGTVKGTITAANVTATGDLKKGDLPALLQAIMSGDAYVNVHTTKNPGGEIRGQVEAGK